MKEGFVASHTKDPEETPTSDVEIQLPSFTAKGSRNLSPVRGRKAKARWRRKQPEQVILYRLSDGKDIIKIAERTDLTQTVDIATMFGK